MAYELDRLSTPPPLTIDAKTPLDSEDQRSLRFVRLV